MSKIENCENCGGTHYGSVDCPYLEKNMGQPCVICAERTSYCCSDCAIDGKGKVYVCIDDDCRSRHEKQHKGMTDQLSPWPERRPHRTEGDRSRFATAMSAHLPIPDAAMVVHFSDDDMKAMKAAFIMRFDEQLPRTETMMAVAHIGYRMALRDTQAKK